MTNTAIADNSIFGLRDCPGALESAGGNFIGATNDECEIADQASDILDGGGPGLGDLTNNGGPTRTLGASVTAEPSNAESVPPFRIGGGRVTVNRGSQFSYTI